MKNLPDRKIYGHSSFNTEPYQPPLQIATINTNQQYMFLSSLNNNLVLDVNISKNNYGQLISYQRTNKKNQLFKILQYSGTRYQIKSCQNNNILSVRSNTQKDGETICTSINYGLNGQIWEFQYAKNNKQNWFYIKNDKGKYMQILDGKAFKIQPVVQWSDKGKDKQSWLMLPM